MNRNLSLEELENDYWVNPNFYPSKLIERCYTFRKIPLNMLSVEQLRTLVGQQIGLNFLLSVVFEELRKNILAEGDFYEGDLLESVLRAKKEFWLSHLKFHKELKIIIKENIDLIEDAKLLLSIENFMGFIVD